MQKYMPSPHYLSDLYNWPWTCSDNTSSYGERERGGEAGTRIPDTDANAGGCHSSPTPTPSASEMQWNYHFQLQLPHTRRFSEGRCGSGGRGRWEGVAGRMGVAGGAARLKRLLGRCWVHVARLWSLLCLHVFLLPPPSLSLSLSLSLAQPLPLTRTPLQPVSWLAKDPAPVMPSDLRKRFWDICGPGIYFL